MNFYSVVKDYFGFKKLLRNCQFTRYRVVKLRCLQDNTKKKQLCAFGKKCFDKEDIFGAFKRYFKIRRTTLNTRCTWTKIEVAKIKLETA